MKAAGQYLAGLGAVGALAATAGAVIPASRPGIWLALGVTLLIQGPLGWWLIRSLGSERLLPVWGLGIGARFALMGVFGLAVIPALAWPLAPTLISLAALLGALLVVESVVLWLAQPAPRARPVIEVR